MSSSRKHRTSSKDITISLSKSSNSQGKMSEQDRKTKLREISKQNERIEKRKLYKKNRYINDRKKAATIKLDELLFWWEDNPNLTDREMRKFYKYYDRTIAEIRDAEDLEEIKRIIKSIPIPKPRDNSSESESD